MSMLAMCYASVITGHDRRTLDLSNAPLKTRHIQHRDLTSKTYLSSSPSSSSRPGSSCGSPWPGRLVICQVCP